MNSINAIAASGIRAGMQQLQQAASQVAGIGNPDGAGVDTLADGLVAGLEARNTVAANAQVLRRSDEVIGTLLDVLA